MPDKKVERRAKNALEKIDKMIREIQSWRGEKPKVVRVTHGDYLALVECDKLNHFPGIEVKPG